MLEVLATLWTVSLVVLGAALSAVIVGQNATRLARATWARLADRRQRPAFPAPHPTSS